jgi:hypothetical protein
MSRRWRRRIRFIILGLIVIPITLFLIRREFIFAWSEDELRDAIAETERLDPHWRWDDLQANRVQVPDEENAVFQVRKVKKLLGPDTDIPTDRGYRLNANQFRPKPYPPNRMAPDEDRERLESFLEEYAAAVEAARRMANFPRGRFLIEMAENPLMTLLTDVQDWRHVLTLLQVDSEGHLLAGNTREALTDIHTLLASINGFADEPYFITQLVRMAGSSIALQQLERVMAQSEPGPELTRLIAELEKGANDPRVYHGLRGERASLFLLMDRLANGILKFNHLGENKKPDPGLAGHIGWFIYRARFPADQAFCLREFNKLIEGAKLPAHEQREVFARLEHTIKAHMEEHKLTGLIFPSVDRIHYGELRTRAMFLSARVAIAVERFRQINQRWPESLAELPKDLLPAIPPDPYDGQPLHYRRTDYGVVIYAVAENKTDDGGKVEHDREFRGGYADVGFRLYDLDKRRLPPPNPPWFSDSAADAAIGVGSGVLVDPLEQELDVIPFIPRK